MSMQKVVTNLERYLRQNVGEGVIDFRVRAQLDQYGVVTFYIHPVGVDGETVDFRVSNNTLITITEQG